MKKLNIILITIVFISCGSRKTTSEKSKEETKKEIIDNSIKQTTTNTNVKETTTVKVDDKNETVTEETILEPSDNTNESYVIEKDGTKTVLKNTKKTVRKMTKKNNIQTSSNIDVQEVKKEDLKEEKAVVGTEVSKKEIKQKETDRKALPWYYWLIFLIIIAFIYYGLKKFRII